LRVGSGLWFVIFRIPLGVGLKLASICTARHEHS
jgi:hypothetical protein